jgi:sirohydrochlorin cobaltochelatase
MSPRVDPVLDAALDRDECFIGQIAIRRRPAGFILTHRAEEPSSALQEFHSADDARELARFNDSGKYRPLKTAPNLRHGWLLKLPDIEAIRRALDYFYPGRLAVLLRWKRKELRITPMRQTLERQSGMYRIAAKISDEQLQTVVANLCRSDGGCLRTILWKRDAAGGQASRHLPSQKYDPAVDQTGASAQFIPLLCQEACNLLVNECRKAVRPTSAG